METVIGWPVALAARSLALQWLGDAGQAAERLEAGADAEALHDFRVGLRRLRVTLKAYRPWLADSVPAKRRGKLGKLAGATGSSRDSEVQLTWIDQQTPGGAAEAEALADLRRGVEGPEPPGCDLDGVLRRFRRQKERLEAELGHVAVERADSGRAEPLFGVATAPIAVERLERLASALVRIARPEDDAAIHQARLATKRLRYLLEPVAAEVHECSLACAELAALQDLLGRLHDVEILSRRIGAARAGAASDRVAAGYVLLSWRLERSRLKLFGALARAWLHAGATGGLWSAVGALSWPQVSPRRMELPAGNGHRSGSTVERRAGGVVE